MAPDTTLCVIERGEGSLFSPPKGREIPMKLIRLQRHQHPRPPHHELRQKRVLDSGYRSLGQVENLYVNEDMELHFVDVATSGFMGLRTKHHLVPVEAIASEDAGSITLAVDQQAVERPDLRRPTRRARGGPTACHPRALRLRLGSTTLKTA